MYVTCIPTYIYNGAIYSEFIFIQRTAVMQIYTDPFYALRTFSEWRIRDGRKEKRTERKRQDCIDTQNRFTFPGFF